MKKLLFLFILFSSQVFSQDVYFCNKVLEKLPIQQGGRIKPLYVHARESLKQLTGKKNPLSLDPVVAYCLLSVRGLGLPSETNITAKIEHEQIKDLLGFSGKKHPEVDYDKLLLKQDEIRRELMRQKDESGYKKALNTLFNQIHLYSEIINAQNWTVAEVEGTNVRWLPIGEFLREEKIIEARRTDAKPFLKVLNQSGDDYTKLKGEKHLLELNYARAHLPGWSLLLSLLAIATLVLFKKFNIALGLTAATLLVQTTLIVLRVMISGRAPITNMYETVMFSGYGALLLAMIVGHFKKEKIFVYLGLAYNVCTLMMMNFAGSMLSDEISPLVPVLRDNFWLSTHVTTIIMSYGALALSWILANTVLLKRRFTGLSKEDEKYYNDLNYTCLKYGIVLLAAGIILGGVWADYSWGRFWGWDPKETWSLIVLCLYMAILHGRYTNWITVKRFAPLTAAAFMSVMMAWFGVNYILASGLHSYGFSQGGAIFIGTFFLIQIIVLILTSFERKEANTPA